MLILQVREQQKYIAFQIRQKVKQRREEQLHKLEEALRDEWQKAQDQKMQALEELYLSSLRAIGEGHRQAKENCSSDVEGLGEQMHVNTLWKWKDKEQPKLPACRLLRHILLREY
ncbi:hypothetical protein llap_21456 [Limosa lapponica baueri]|uniref:CE295 protein n=1 Tax=Limosa lapponica baueri TaxID=1758121 RepID=A0A2I0T359_LIMLA|nr:hypothetical protein llap_21456 [Limosa lapponica baueri]